MKCSDHCNSFSLFRRSKIASHSGSLFPMFSFFGHASARYPPGIEVNVAATASFCICVATAAIAFNKAAVPFASQDAAEREAELLGYREFCDLFSFLSRNDSPLCSLSPEPTSLQLICLQQALTLYRCNSYLNKTGAKFN